MGYELREVVKVSAGVVLSAAALRYLWKRAAAAEAGRLPVVATPPRVAAVAAAGAEAGASAPASGAAPEDGVWVYFGSQSGTAEGFSKELEQEAGGHDLKARVVDMEDFDPERFRKHKVVICVVATYGEGEPTDNSAEFFRWIKDEGLGAETLEGMKFCVMGLGNRQYVNFNSCGKMADEHLERLGAERFYGLGLGDDAQNIQEDFEQWKENGLWPALREACGKLPHQADGSPSGCLPTREEVLEALPLRAEVEGHATDLPMDPLVQKAGADVLGKWYFQAHAATVVAERELRQVSDLQAGKSTKHLDFELKWASTIDWQTADNLEVLPRNPAETVEWFARRLQVHDRLESSVAFVRAQGVERSVKMPFPTPCTAQDALTLYCDLCQAPSRQVAKKLAPFIQDEEARNAFVDLVEDRPAYQWLTGEGVRVTFQELFELFFESADIDFSTFLQLCPRQRSRPYTIASSSLEDQNKISICVGVVAEKLQPFAQIVEGLGAKGRAAPGAAAYLERLGNAAKEPRSFRGACSSMLCGQVTVGDKLWIASRPSTFRLPRETTTPIIMIGAGTGIAPFRGYVREFTAEAGVRTKTMLFFGCTKASEDFLYKDELNEALGGGEKILSELITAFSREQNRKIYIQDRLRERAEDVAALVEEGGRIYVCGAAAMGAAIREELATALGSSDCVSQMQSKGRFVEELW